jgi:hypothetical protein
MSMQINPYTKITLLDPDFVHAINNVLESSADTSVRRQNLLDSSCPDLRGTSAHQV